MIKNLTILVFTASLLTAAVASAAAAMQLSSPAFKNGAQIPAVYARSAVGGSNVSIPLEWAGAPEGTKSFAISIIDQHPIARNWVHWIVINVPANVKLLPEGASGRSMPPGSIEIKNSFGEAGYGGPQPPRGSGAHQYVVTVYALKEPKVSLRPDATLSDFQDALKGKILEQASITGLFER